MDELEAIKQSSSVVSVSIVEDRAVPATLVVFLPPTFVAPGVLGQTDLPI